MESFEDVAEERLIVSLYVATYVEIDCLNELPKCWIF